MTGPRPCGAPGICCSKMESKPVPVPSKCMCCTFMRASDSAALELTTECSRRQSRHRRWQGSCRQVVLHRAIKQVHLGVLIALRPPGCTCRSTTAGGWMLGEGSHPIMRRLRSLTHQNSRNEPASRVESVTAMAPCGGSGGSRWPCSGASKRPLTASLPTRCRVLEGTCRYSHRLQYHSRGRSCSAGRATPCCNPSMLQTSPLHATTLHVWCMW